MRSEVAVLAALVIASGLGCRRGVSTGSGGSAFDGELTSAEPAPTPPPAATTIEQRTSPRPPTPKSPFHDGEPIQVADPAHVDPVELLDQARRIALRMDEHAVLMRISAIKGVSAGTVDVTGDGGVTYEFEWLYFDKSRPPGNDKVENGLWISARRGRFSVMELGHATSLSRTQGLRPDPAPIPRCSARAAWKAAVKSGMPETAVAWLSYAPAFPPRAGQPYVWDFRVEGHDELRRTVDGATCTIAKQSRRVPGRR